MKAEYSCGYWDSRDIVSWVLENEITWSGFDVLDRHVLCSVIWEGAENCQKSDFKDRSLRLRDL